MARQITEAIDWARTNLGPFAPITDDDLDGLTFDAMSVIAGIVGEDHPLWGDLDAQCPTLGDDVTDFADALVDALLNDVAPILN